jgi:hypothetical protein
MLIRAPRRLRQVAKALIEYETLWHQAWLRNVDEWKAGLQVRGGATQPAAPVAW